MPDSRRSAILKFVNAAGLAAVACAACILVGGWLLTSPPAKTPELAFNVAPPLRECAGREFGVYGLQTIGADLALDKKARKKNEKFLDKVKRKLGVYATKIQSILPIKRERSFRLRYVVTQLPELADTKVQDVSMSLPDSFHKERIYELACKIQGGAGEYVVFRKLGPRTAETNYYEPSTSLLPKKCIGFSGEVLVRVVDGTPTHTLERELKTTGFRATAWDSTRQITHKAALDLYFPKVTYTAGEKIAVHAHGLNTSSPASLEILKIGRKSSLLQRTDDIRLQKQKIDAYSYRDGARWPVTTTITLPAKAASGYYVAVLKQKDKSAVFPFVVSPSSPKARVAVIAATNTWQAYNNWGDGSFYESAVFENCLATDYARIISTSRPTLQPNPLMPYAKYNHLASAERRMAAFFDDNNIGYDVYSDDSLDESGDFLKSYDVAVLPPHPEYYTAAMVDALDAHVKRGGSIASLGGNAVYYKIAKRGSQLEKHENGRVQDLEEGFGGIWSIHHGRSPANLLGTEFDVRGFTTLAPYKVLDAGHPLFEGTGLKNGDLLGNFGSGHEMDVAGAHSPSGVVVLAKGINPSGYGADMAFYQHPSGGKIFAVGSLSFVYPLEWDDKLQRILKNAIAAMLDKPE